MHYNFITIITRFSCSHAVTSMSTPSTVVQTQEAVTNESCN